MGKLETIIDLINKTITLDWSALTDEQLYWAGRAQGYPEEISDSEGNSIPNPVPVVPWILSKRLAELADAAYRQYLMETPDTRIADAEEIADFKPE